MLLACAATWNRQHWRRLNGVSASESCLSNDWLPSRGVNRRESNVSERVGSRVTETWLYPARTTRGERIDTCTLLRFLGLGSSKVRSLFIAYEGMWDGETRRLHVIVADRGVNVPCILPMCIEVSLLFQPGLRSGIHITYSSNAIGNVHIGTRPMNQVKTVMSDTQR